MASVIHLLCSLFISIVESRSNRHLNKMEVTDNREELEPTETTFDESLAKEINNLRSTYVQIEKTITSLQEDCDEVKSENDDLKQKLAKSKADDEAQLKNISNQNKLLQLQAEQISQLESSYSQLENKLASLEGQWAAVELENVTLKLKIKADDSLQLAIIDDLIAQNQTQLEQINQFVIENDEKKSLCCLLKKKQGSISAQEQLIVLDKAKKEAEAKCKSLNEDIAALNAQLTQKDELISKEKSETIKWMEQYKILIKNVDKLVEHHNAATDSMIKQMQNQSDQIKMLNQIKHKIAESNEEDLMDIALMKAIVSATREQLEAKAVGEAQQLATISSLREQVSSLNIKLAQKDRIINYEQEELMKSKSKTDKLAKEIDQLLYDKSVEDEANASALNQRHLKKSICKLAKLFGDDVPTSTFHLRSNRKKHWTSEKMKPLKFLNAIEKELKKGKLDKVIDGKLGKSPEGVSITWADAIQQFIDAARREFIDVVDPSSNQESDFERLIKARYILESAKTNWLKPIPIEVHNCMFQMLKQQPASD